MTTNGNVTVGDCLSFATKKLREAGGFATPRLDCEVLLGHVLGCSRVDLLFNRDKKMSDTKRNEFFLMIHRRVQHEPVSYLTHSKEFMSLDFFVEQGVLIPRPETELLTEFIIRTFQNANDVSILDLCTGSGAIAVSLAYYLKHARLTAVDKYDVCIRMAVKNAERHAVGNRFTSIKADVLSDFCIKQKFHCIVSNPPYIKENELTSLPSDVKDFEPDYALNGGSDGLLFYRKITEFAKKNLLPHGILVFEIGFDQGDSVKNIVEESNCFHAVTVTKDFAGLDRMVTAVKGAEACG